MCTDHTFSGLLFSNGVFLFHVMLETKIQLLVLYYKGNGKSLSESNCLEHL